jgi:hypothetical protein
MGFDAIRIQWEEVTGRPLHRLIDVGVMVNIEGGGTE